ncbi:MAG: aminoacyl-tRNA hydrolase [Elusimicrobiota bacterium]|nr:aminoacyl-tRNA hydrolase [Elusimicrobiota bacterium]
MQKQGTYRKCGSGKVKAQLKMRLIVGLGNPGKEYESTRHNTGFLVLDELSKRWSVNSTSCPKGGGITRGVVKKFKLVKEFNSQVASKIFDNQLVYLLKPLTYMNLCGVAVKKFAEKHFIKVTEILVICDDFSLPLGRLRLRKFGSSGGHKGLESIIENLSSSQFARLRIGIGPVPAGLSNEDFVLSEFTVGERLKLKGIIDFAILSIEKIFQVGIDKAMGIVNPVDACISVTNKEPMSCSPAV